MKRHLRLMLCAACLSAVCCSRKKAVQISGRVYDKETGNPVAARVFIKSSHEYTEADSIGAYCIKTPPLHNNNTVIVYTAHSFDTVRVELVLVSSGKKQYEIDVSLEKNDGLSR